MTEIIFKSKIRDDIIKLEKNIREILKHHFKMKNYFSWKAPKGNDERAKYNKDNSRYFHFIYEDKDVILKCKTFCSGERIFYKGEFIVNNKTVTQREIRKLLWVIREYLGMESKYMKKDGTIITVNKDNPVPYY